MNRAIVIAALVLLTLTGCGGSIYRLQLKVDAPAALSAASRNPTVNHLIKKNFRKPFLKKVTCYLDWPERSKRYLWRVEYIDSSCGCGGSPPRVTALVDPFSGRITSVGLTRRPAEKATCLRSCHYR